MRNRLLLTVAPMLLLALGCGDSNHAPVSGTVTRDGKPLANVVVIFQPAGDGPLNPGMGSTGRTNDKGEYALKVVGGGAGAVVGKHRVEILPTVAGDDDRRASLNTKIPARYNSKTQLKFEVRPGPNTANFELASK